MPKKGEDNKIWESFIDLIIKIKTAKNLGAVEATSMSRNDEKASQINSDFW